MERTPSRPRLSIFLHAPKFGSAFDPSRSSSLFLMAGQNQGRCPPIYCWTNDRSNKQLCTTVRSNDESAFVVTLSVLCSPLASAAGSYRRCDTEGFRAGAMDGWAKLRRVCIFLDCTRSYQNAHLVHIGIACEHGSHSHCDCHFVQTFG